MLALLLAAAQAATPAEVLARVDEVAALRSRRDDRGAPPVARDVYARAAAGQVVTGTTEVPGQAAKKVWGVAVVDVPIGRYWAALNDDLSKPEWTKLDYVEVVSGAPCEAPRRVFQFAPVPLVTDRWWYVNVRYNEALQAQTAGRVREQWWVSDGDWSTPTAGTTAWAAKGMHIAATQGSWFLVDLDGRSTLVEYYTFSDPGGAIPAGLASSLAAGGVDDTIQQYAKLAASGPRCPIR